MSDHDQPEVYDSAGEEEVDALAAEVEEAADAARQDLWGDGDRETIMRNYLLRHVKNKNLKFDYRDDKSIMEILKLKGSKLEAQFNYVKSQVRENEDHGLTNIIVDNLANLVYKISEDTKTRERVQTDEKLRALVNKKIGSFDYIPDWFQLGLCLGNHIFNALTTRRDKIARAKAGVLPPATD